MLWKIRWARLLNLNKTAPSVHAFFHSDPICCLTLTLKTQRIKGFFFINSNKNDLWGWFSVFVLDSPAAGWGGALNLSSAHSSLLASPVILKESSDSPARPPALPEQLLTHDSQCRTKGRSYVTSATNLKKWARRRSALLSGQNNKGAWVTSTDLNCTQIPSCMLLGLQSRAAPLQPLTQILVFDSMHGLNHLRSLLMQSKNDS